MPMEESLCLADDSAAAAEAEFPDGVEAAVRELLLGLGEDPERDGLRRTPHRVAKAFRDATRGYSHVVSNIVDTALFPEAGVDAKTGSAGGTGGLVVVRDIDLFSYCESCLLPFGVQFHVGYVPSAKKVLGLSKVSRVADVFAKRLQSPQRLANEICAALNTSIRPSGVVVALQCWHIPILDASTCNSVQGLVKSSFCSRSGIFEDINSSLFDDFLALLKSSGVTLEKSKVNSSVSDSWCPMRSLESSLCNGHAAKTYTNGGITARPYSVNSNMVSAVSSILRSFGEDTSRKELVGTPERYAQWLMKFKFSDVDVKLNHLTANNTNGTTNFNHLTANNMNGSAGLNHLMASSMNGINGKHGNGCQSDISSCLRLPFFSQCEHHLLPFYGLVHIGYFNDGSRTVLEQAFLQSLVHFYGFRLQVQERFTRQIAEAVFALAGTGSIVVVEASHICMISRGIEKVRSSTVTIAVMGRFLTDHAAKALFLQSISDAGAFVG